MFSFQLCRELYSNLSRIAGSGVENPLFSQKLSELEPIIRYCHFNLSREGEEFDATSLLDMRGDTDNEVLRRRVENALEDSRHEQAKNLQDVEWNGIKIPIKDATLKNLILSTREHDYELQKAHTMDERMEIYDNMFIVFNDMLRMLESEKDVSMEHYVRFQMLDKMIERNTFLVEADMETLKWESAAKMATKTLSSVDEMAAIKGVTAEAIQARRYYILALHAHCIGELHGMRHENAKAASIFQHGLQLTDTCRSCCEEGNPILSRANELHDRMKRAQLLQRARGVLESSGAEPSGVETMVKDMDLGGTRGAPSFVGQKLGDVRHGMDANVRLCDFPQESFDPVPTKPVFFDVAEQYIMYPDLEGKVEKKRSGFFGFFSR
jgi:signal recognition particle subunit SRP68